MAIATDLHPCASHTTRAGPSVRAVSPELTEFVALVEKLRLLGAVRVRSGAHEAAFGSEPREPEAAPPKPMAPLSKSERAELEELRRERERAEELG